MINFSFETGIFPDQLKIAKVIPVHKKNSKCNVDNYRPISLTSVLSKIYEYAMLERLLSFIEKFGLIPKEQHGFRMHKSTTTATVECYLNILEELDNKKYPVGIFCDLSKAFDCVPHEKLLDKLWNLGFRGNTHNWLKSYLSHRSQYVELSHKDGAGCTTSYCSDILPMNIGVPQGSVLAPILFSLYIADIVNYLPDYKITLYADDSTFLVSKESLEINQTACNNLLDKLMKWFSTNKLYLNISKTKFLIFHTRQKIIEGFNISTSNISIQRCDTTTFLGLLVKDTLDWEPHIIQTLKKLNTTIYQLRCMHPVLTTNILRNFYFAEVQSRLTYGILLWGTSPAAHKLFLAQKKALRAMLNVDQNQSCRQIFIDLKILPLSCLYILEVACNIYRNEPRIPSHGDIHNHETRNKNLLYTPQNSLTVTMRGPVSMGIRIFNKLPIYIKRQTTYLRFRKSLKDLLLQYSFYSFDEFFAKIL